MAEEAAASPLSINDIVADLKGFGIEDFNEVITLTSGRKTVNIKLANIPGEDENIALLAVEEFKGYTWIQEVKNEILSRSISWINGIDIRSLSPRERRVIDPADGMEKDIQVVLRNTLKGWGQEFRNALWKVLMVHSQSIEDRLLESFPETAIMTEAERRLLERARQEVEEATKEVITDQVAQLFEEGEDLA